MVCFQETSQTRAAVREVKVLQSCQLYPAKSNSGLRETCQISAAGSAGDRKLQADHADEIGSTTCCSCVTSRTTRERQIPVGTRESDTTFPMIFCQKKKIEQMFMLESLRPCQHPVVQPWRVILSAINHPGSSALATALAPSMVCDTLDINHPGLGYLRRA